MDFFPIGQGAAPSTHVILNELELANRVDLTVVSTSALCLSGFSFFVDYSLDKLVVPIGLR